MKRLDLAEVVLTLKASGVKDVKSFRWLEAPEQRALERAETLLSHLDAIDDQSGAITSLGRRMLAFPAHPRYSRMLLAGQEFGCVRAVALMAALTQGRDLLLRGNSDAAARDEIFLEESESDFFVLMRAWRYAEGHGFNPERCRRVGINAQAARQVGSIFEQFVQIATDEGLNLNDRQAADDIVQRCILLGFPDQLAKRLDDSSRRCALVHNRTGTLARESIVKAPLFVAGDVREVQSGGGRDRALNVLLNLATAVKEEWLRELFPGHFSKVHSVVFDPALRRVVARQEVRFRDLLLDEMLGENPPTDEAAAILAREVAAGRSALENWDDAVEQWILRVNRLRSWMPELELPAIEDKDRAVMIEHVCHGAFSCAEIKDRAVLPIVKSWLSQRQQSWVDEHAPERIELPRGRKVKVAYSIDGPPTIAARIQDLYGIKDGLRIASRRVPVRIQVLAPSNRPVQVTENLADFWRETYPKLKQQLQRRYPKHEWR